MAVFADLFEAARRDIFVYAKMLRWNPTWQQAELLKCVQLEANTHPSQRKKRIAVKSGQGPGKTAAECVVGSWRAVRELDSLTIVTSPTLRQVRDVWMAELRRLMINAAPELQRVIEIDSFQMKIAGRADWGVKTVAANRRENVQGYHQKHLTFIFDEASGIAPDIWETAKGTLTNEDSLLIAAGNPNSIGTPFHNCFTVDRDLWHLFTWNAEKSPNVDQTNVRRMAREFGIDSDAYRVRVLGEFPKMDPSCVISIEDLDACSRLRMDQQARIEIPDSPVKRQIGIDLARYGNDESVIVARRNSAIVGFETYAKREPADVIRRAFILERELGWTDAFYVFDAGGMGQGLAHLFHEAHKPHMEFHFNGLPQDASYADKITEAYFMVKKLAASRSISIPKDARLIQQLGTRRYKIVKDKVKIESKEDYMKRIGTEDATSPDRADAFVMALYQGVYAKTKIASATDPKVFTGAKRLLPSRSQR